MTLILRSTWISDRCILQEKMGYPLTIRSGYPQALPYSSIDCWWMTAFTPIPFFHFFSFPSVLYSPLSMDLLHRYTHIQHIIHHFLQAIIRFTTAISSSMISSTRTNSETPHSFIVFSCFACSHLACLQLPPFCCVVCCVR